MVKKSERHIKSQVWIVDVKNRKREMKKMMNNWINTTCSVQLNSTEKVGGWRYNELSKTFQIKKNFTIAII